MGLSKFLWMVGLTTILVATAAIDAATCPPAYWNDLVPCKNYIENYVAGGTAYQQSCCDSVNNLYDSTQDSDARQQICSCLQELAAIAQYIPYPFIQMWGSCLNDDAKTAITNCITNVG